MVLRVLAFFGSVKMATTATAQIGLSGCRKIEQQNAAFVIWGALADIFAKHNVLQLGSDIKLQAGPFVSFCVCFIFLFNSLSRFQLRGTVLTFFYDSVRNGLPRYEGWMHVLSQQRWTDFGRFHEKTSFVQRSQGTEPVSFQSRRLLTDPFCWGLTGVTDLEKIIWNRWLRQTFIAPLFHAFDPGPTVDNQIGPAFV